MRRDVLHRASRMLKTLADPTRLNMLSLLGEGELPVKRLSEALGMEQSAVSHQLAVLRRERLVASRRQGRQTFYSLCDHHIGSVLSQVLEHVQEEQA